MPYLESAIDDHARHVWNDVLEASRGHYDALWERIKKVIDAAINDSVDALNPVEIETCSDEELIALIN